MQTDTILEAWLFAAVREARRRERAQREIMLLMLDVIRENRPEVAAAIEKLLEVASERD